MKKLLIPLIISLLITGCGSSSYDSVTDATSVSSNVGISSVSNYNYDKTSDSIETTEAAETYDETETNNDINTEQKLIKTVSLNVETKSFDEMLSFIVNKTSELNGYVENSDISGYGYEDYEGFTRSATYTIRIPKDKADSFVDEISAEGHITSKNENVEDVTLQYIDIDSHIKALETEYNKLLELMDKAENMEDVISIQSRISQITYEKQNYESQLRVMDNKIEYTKISIYVDEVEKISPVEKKSFFGEINERFVNNVKDIATGIRSFLITVISSIPYIVLYVVIIWIFICIIRKINKKMKEKRLNNKKE